MKKFYVTVALTDELKRHEDRAAAVAEVQAAAEKVPGTFCILELTDVVSSTCHVVSEDVE